MNTPTFAGPTTSLAEAAAQKLPAEAEHLDALGRMRVLDDYYRWVFGLCRDRIAGRVLDAGAGVGSFTELVASRAASVVAIDLSPKNVEALEDRFRETSNVAVRQRDLDGPIADLADPPFDTVTCLDVLEHIENDAALLTRFREAVVPGGHLVLKVPACPWLFGAVDVASGHFRRYSKHGLTGLLRETGWEPVSVRYMNLFGVAPYFVKSRLLGRAKNFSRTFAPWQLRAIRSAMPTLARLDGLIGPPVGQSLVAVARRPEGAGAR